MFAIRTVMLAAIVVCSTAPFAFGQFSTTFEAPDYNGSAAGTVLTGQDNFILPAGVDAMVYTYAGNTLGLPANPVGGSQFIAGTGPGGNDFARGQRPVSFSGADNWTISFDAAMTFVGTLPSAQNIGSMSTQTFPGDATFIALPRWTDPNTAYNPPDRYLFGGAAGAPTPTGFRLFAGAGAVAGNVFAMDNMNISIVPEPTTFTLSALGLLGLLGFARRRRRRAA